VHVALRQAVTTLFLASHGCPQTGAGGAEPTRLFDAPERVSIRGHEGDAMEPFVTRDGRFLLFNNRNDPSENTNLHLAERVDDLTFDYRGELPGVNTAALEGVPTMDRDGAFYFVSPRSYRDTLSTIYRGTFRNGRIDDVALVPGVSPRQAGIVDFDVEVSPDGHTLYVAEGRFVAGNPLPQSADIVVFERRESGFERRPDTKRVMQNVNTADLEYAACISADGLTLFFTRAGKTMAGSPAILVAARKSKDAAFDEPRHLAAIEGFVEAPTLSPEERSLYFHKRDGRRFVLYRVTRR